MIRIYIDEQRTRTQFRVRVMDGNLLRIAFYAKTREEAERIRRFVRKVINVFDGGRNVSY